MGILDTAQSLAEKERAEKERIHQAELKERREREELVQLTKAETIHLLMNEIDGIKGFTVKQIDDKTYEGRIAEIEQKLPSGAYCSIGNVYVKHETYTFRGSDECPEQECEHVVISLRSSYRGDSYAGASIGHKSEITNTMTKFGESLAKYLKKYL